MITAMKRFLMIGVALLVGCLIGAGVAHWAFSAAHPTSHVIDPGTDALSILDEEIMSITYATHRLTVTAQRTKPADRFAVQVTFSDGSPARQCIASPMLNGLLPGMATLTAKRQIPLDQVAVAFPKPLGRLEFRNRETVELISPVEFRTTATNSAVLAVFSGMAFEVAAPIDFQKLEALCAQRH
ncbi:MULTISPECIES: hypothetical protein [Ralstonia solanacearum species complex]|uniref:Lipoprotein transmembrane n=2 Tax=Ralstonia solanacearum species complex TaxID=3116862 RepID=A0A454TQ34_9RALS|nr:hypothetical protein [Ralstonia pseudosolanacearum]AKZ24994.1 membrane protein [Ralstonia solanacearum]AUS43748.1 hypothetical protein CYD94_17310 [Ralstonia solanacearum]AYA47977.1 hypothetical protein RSP824_16755 [Ralstonia pseudosolanacearum]MBX9431915.1 hypothetical protein [Ralstonia pseudosolanacearum]MCK4132038.1 hypothetical protein [Ralstonia pseudosolanacearum]